MNIYHKIVSIDILPVRPASVAQWDARLTGGHVFDPCQVWQHSFVEINLEIYPTVILSLPLTQEGQLSDSGERMCTSTC